jgi:hypothetical protein
MGAGRTGLLETKKSATGKVALNSTKGGRWRRQHVTTQAERLRELIMAVQHEKSKLFLCIAAIMGINRAGQDIPS